VFRVTSDVFSHQRFKAGLQQIDLDELAPAVQKLGGFVLETLCKIAAVSEFIKNCARCNEELARRLQFVQTHECPPFSDCISARNLRLGLSQIPVRIIMANVPIETRSPKCHSKGDTNSNVVSSL
jgi:hypothetical protein